MTRAPCFGCCWSFIVIKPDSLPLGKLTVRRRHDFSHVFVELLRCFEHFLEMRMVEDLSSRLSISFGQSIVLSIIVREGDSRLKGVADLAPVPPTYFCVLVELLLGPPHNLPIPDDKSHFFFFQLLQLEDSVNIILEDLSSLFPV